MKIRTVAARVRALAAAVTKQQQAVFACSTAFACGSVCLQQRLLQQQQQQQQHLRDQYRVRRHAPDRRYDALFPVEPLSFLWSYSRDCIADLMVVVEIQKRRLQDAKSVCVKRMVRVRRRGFARRACCCCRLLFPLLVAAAAACSRCCCCTRVHACAADDVPQRVASQRQRCLNGKEVWSTPISGKAWPIQSVRKVVGQQNEAVDSHITH